MTEAQECLIKDLKNYITGGIWKMLITEETWCSLLNLSLQDFYYFIQQHVIDNSYGNVFGKEINSVDICQAITTSTMDTAMMLSAIIAEEVGISVRGVRHELKRGEVEIEIGQQTYSIPAGREIKHVFFETPSAIDIAKFASWYSNYPFAFGGGGGNAFSGMGAGSAFAGVGNAYLMFPAYQVIQRSMNIGLNQKIMNSELTYKITLGPNKTRLVHLFSIPNQTTFNRVKGCKLIYHYYDTTGMSADDIAICEAECDKIYSPSQVKTPIMKYDNLNEWSKNFIRKWLTAMAKQSEGMARTRFKGKVANIGGVDIELDGDTLIAEAKEEFVDLKSDVREFLMGLRSDKLMERKANEITAHMTVASAMPMGGMYIG
jgi:hypothetical protein